MKSNLHKPVLLKESIKLLDINPTGIYVDATAGRGGHSAEILKHLTTGRLICIDTDNEAVIFLKEKFIDNKNVTIVRGNFKDIKNILYKLGVNKIDGLLLDLGVSSPQLDNLERGFSYHQKSMLDMRMDNTQELDAKYIVNNYSGAELFRIFKEYGEVANPKKVISLILDKRKAGEAITDTNELVKIIKEGSTFKELNSEKHPARKYFQAIRIEVNKELDNLKNVLTSLPEIMNKNGTVVIITFHSLEDRIVKNEFATLCTSEVPNYVPTVNSPAAFVSITKKPVLPSAKEVETNKRSRSAKIRGVKKT
ncbi:MAG: 16S rRNA (cytosine(1402)-N(4))-methyltransferase RsmH [Mycoplasmataceae bacterium]|jgi:16S rRNA (cytosine1402-N4)-methyltransferase|nr:16S rRNA (cytosine(1402)-N(4))-methyltransferase RsmH [Mycoplasmataceae bacterium]